MPLRSGRRRIGRKIALLAPAHHFLDLPHRLPDGRLEPCPLRVGHGDATELANGRPAELTLAQLLSGRGQLFERTRYAQSLRRLARPATKEPLHVLDERPKAKLAVHASS